MANEFKVKKGLIVHGSGSTVLDIQGNSGQLFSVTDDLTGTLFTVSDISGIPIFEVDASGVSTFDGNVGIGTTSPQSLLNLGGTPGLLGSGLTFGDGDTGFYEVSDDTLGVSFGGSRRLRFSLTDVLSEYVGGMFIDYGSAGSSTNPIYSFNTDSDTGIGWGGADTISLITAGSEKMRIDTSGDVGIGTSSPSTRLDVRNNINNVLRVTQDATSLSNNTYTFEIDSTSHVTNMTTAGAMAVDVSSGRAFTINGFGNVGIGTTSPNANLQVEGSVRIGDTTTGATLIRNGNDFEILGLDVDTSSWNSIHIKADGNDGVYIEKDTNNVGIGTTSPSQKLQVVGNIYTTGNIRIEDTGDQLEFGNANVAMQRTSNLLELGGYDGIVFKSSNTALDSQTERMRINAAGNVGIGTTSPDGKLHISRTAAGGTSLLLVENPDATNQSTAAQLQLKTGLNDASIKAVSGPGGAGYLSIFNEASEAMRIDSAGNVGIGTTTPSTELHVVGAITLNDGNDNTKVGTDAGLNYTGTNQSAFGNSAGRGNTGNDQSAFGRLAGRDNTGNYQSAFGYAAGYLNTGTNQSAFGLDAGRSNTGDNQSAFGFYAGRDNTGNNQTAVGYAAGRSNTGKNNSNFGYEAGYYLSDNITINIGSSDSVFLGSNTKALGASQANQIVIGHDATGIGANSVTLGNDSIVTTALKGNVGIGTTSPGAKLEVAGDVSISTDAHVRGKFLAGEDALPQSDHTLANGGSSAITTSTFAINTVSGQILTGQTSGETLENGNLVYLRSNGSWYLADADQTATSISLLGIALKDVTGVGSIDVLIDGVIGIEEDFITFSNIGEPLYIDTAAGKMTNTAPSGAGDIVRVVGHYLGADSTATGVLVAFKPDGTWIEL